MREIFSIPLTVARPTYDDGETALRLAIQRRLSFYDASYVALADSLGCALITADRQFVRRINGRVDVRLLADG